MKRMKHISAPDIEGLRRFAQKSDRQDPPTFVGRKDLMERMAEDLKERIAAWGNHDPDAWAGATWLFQGAPGAGKTALLSRLGSLTIQPTGDGDNGNGEPVGLNVCLIDEEAVFHNPTRLEKKIAEAFVPGAAREMEGRESVGESGEAGIDLKVARAGAQAHRSTDQPLRIWEEVAREVQGEPALHPPLLLMLDEAQALGAEAAPQLRWLHKGAHGLPIVPVFGGLAWTKKRFGELGVSRLSLNRVHTLEALSDSECREAVRAFLDKYRVAGVSGAEEKWERLVARECMGWPQHLHVGLQGLAEALVRSKGDLETMDEKAALEGGASRRIAYYQDRLDSHNLKGNRHLSSVAVSCLRSGEDRVTRATMAGAIREVSDRAGGAGAYDDFALPEGMTPAGYVHGMIRSGILHEDGDGYLSIPIPSFRDFLMERYPAPDRGAAPGTGGLPSPAS